MKRPTWLAAGVVIGVGGTLWAEQRVRRQVRKVADRLTPESMVNEARSLARGAGERVRSAMESGRREQQRTEEALWQDLGGRDGGRPVASPPGTAAAARAATGPLPGHRSTRR